MAMRVTNTLPANCAAEAHSRAILTRPLKTTTLAVISRILGWWSTRPQSPALDKDLHAAVLSMVDETDRKARAHFLRKRNKRTVNMKLTTAGGPA
jgi:hypothetical protein